MLAALAQWWLQNGGGIMSEDFFGVEGQVSDRTDGGGDGEVVTSLLLGRMLFPLSHAVPSLFLYLKNHHAESSSPSSQGLRCEANSELQ
jgi:hypothetical protein